LEKNTNIQNCKDCDAENLFCKDRCKTCYGRYYRKYLMTAEAKAKKNLKAREYSRLPETKAKEAAIWSICSECSKKVNYRLAKAKCKTCYNIEYIATLPPEQLEARRKYQRDYVNRPDRRAIQHARDIGRARRGDGPDNSPEYIAMIKERINKFNVYKLSKGCVDCGYKKHAHALDFDHLRDKKFGVTTAVRNGMAEDKIWDEIAKCELRCANCHREITSKRREELALLRLTTS
jgi:hypothetical protein